MVDKNPFSSFRLSCQHPIEVVHTFNGVSRSMEVPCGCCDLCRSSHRSNLAQRVMYEQATHKFEIFVTLTYSLASVPRAFVSKGQERYLYVHNPRSANHNKIISTHWRSDPEFDYNLAIKQYGPHFRPHHFEQYKILDWDDLRKFIQHVRIDCYRDTHQTLRYFAVGEYGPDSFHPHFHILFWTDDKSCCQWLMKHLHGTTELDDSFPRHKRYMNSKTKVLSRFRSDDDPFWPYGIIDTVLTDGSSGTINYLSTYMNSVVGNRPSVLDLPFTRESSRHSIYLGYSFFKNYYKCDLFKEIISDPYSKKFSLDSTFIFNGKPRQLPMFLFKDAFPKIPFLCFLPRHDIQFLYRLYPSLCKFLRRDCVVSDFLRILQRFCDDPTSLSHELFNFLNRFCICLSLPWAVRSCFSDFSKVPFTLDPDTNPYLSQIRCAFFASSRFFTLCGFGFSSDYESAYSFFVDNLIHFHLYSKPQFLLSRFYYSQCEFYDLFHYRPDFSFNIFYSSASSDSDFDSLLLSISRDQLFEKIKHKKQNDANSIFVDKYN
ncbi:replication initiator protein [Dipodfec virus UA06Rod_3]|uniref:Replication initiator protein n=1 Tax=Dipodfec virus UA06Rod_3 TaxID=2929323 RepID=A0A976R7K9_9VIRU|nr:replication initiator protein [Dipodfec virus UA06Rod_3]